MEAAASEFCCGCLSSDRKMKPINNYWPDGTFVKILTEMPFQLKLDAITRYLCWECEAHLSNFIKFKEQVKMCWKILQEYMLQPQKPSPKTVSKLIPSAPEIYDSVESDNDGNGFKTNGADSPEFEVKVEMESLSDDDRTLLDIVTNDKIKDKEQNPCKEENNPRKQKRKSRREDKSLRKVEKVVRKEEISIRKDSKKRLKKEKKGKVKKKSIQDLIFEEIELTHKEIIEERTRMEARQEYINAMAKCDKCIVPFANEDDYKEHLQQKHTLMSKHKCDVCTRSFANNAALVRHFRRHSVRWRCTVCSSYSTAAGAALAHYRRTHAQPKSEIHDLAAKAFESYEEKVQENTEVRPKSSDQIPCEYCDKTFRWKTSLRKHMETHSIESGHKRKPYCEPCNLSFTTTANLKKHMQASSKHQIQLKLRKLKDSPPADSDATQQAQAIENIKSSILSGKEHFPCPQCEKKFQWKGNLWRHLQSHAARAHGGLVCEPCNRTFSSIATYKQHMEISRKHVSEDEFKYMCSECGKRFYNKIKLRDHIDWEHLKNYKHICSVCQKVFKSHTSLYLHRQVVHKLNNTNHLCDHCGKSFPNKTKLRSHVTALHTKDSPYKCPTCNARFSWHSCLSRHMRRVHRARPTSEVKI